MPIDNQSSYLRRDITTLGVLVLIIAAAMFALWYAEQHGSWFTNTAARLLDALSS